MRFNLLSSFAAGMLVTTIISGAVYFNDKTATTKVAVKSTVTQKTVKVSLTENEMKDKLTTAGYVVQTKADYDKTLSDAKTSGQKPAAPAATSSSKTATQVILNVTDGMTSIDIGRTLVKAGIVKNAVAFSKNIEGRGLEKHLRPGIFEVNSNMTYNQVVSTIFK